MKRFFHLVCIAAIAAASATAAFGATEASETKEKISVLVITGGHGFDQKVFPEAFAGQDDLDVTFKDTGKEGPGAVFDDVSDWSYDAFVLYNFNQKMTEKQRANFVGLLEKGVGLVVMHHAIAAYPDWAEFEKIIGAKYFLKDTERDGVLYKRCTWKHGVDMPIVVENRRHPIVKGMANFEIHDETYKGWFFQEEGNRLLMSTKEPQSNSQIAWTRRYAKARVFCTVLGHGPEAFRNKSLQNHLAQGIRWTAKKIGAPKAAGERKAGAAKK